tara:strand:+ start:588 stop:1007 length:420 start_codon:yes stop_codon:yes gene_type:complete
MATTTATVSITSGNLQPGNRLAINASSTLTQTGITAGLEVMEQGRVKVPTGTEFSLVEPLGTANGANYVYICNMSTDDQYYVEFVIGDAVIGYLQAGDWMFIPWNMSDAAAEIEVEASGGTNILEYAVFKTDWTLPTAS